MGTGYVRNDTPNNIADGNVINASDLDGEFDAVQAAFNASSGHSHDGTAGEGPPIDTAGLASNAVTTVKITDANVTLAKMAANSVDSDQYVDGSIDTVHIADNAVTAAKLDETGTYTVAGLNTTGDVSFGDNDKATFGAGSDLKIYHDSFNSYIDDSGTGGLNIRGASYINLQKYTGETMALFNADGAVELRHNNATKFATTASGIDVTGGLNTTANVGIGTSSPASALHISSNTYPQLEIDDKASRNYAMGVTAATFRIRDVTGAADRLTIDAGGNVGIGTTATSGAKLKVDGGATAGTVIQAGNAQGGVILGAESSTAYVNTTSATPLAFEINNSEHMRVDSGGKLNVNNTTGSARVNISADNWPENALALYSAGIAGQTNFAGMGFFNQDADSPIGQVADIYTNPTGTLSLTASGNPAIQLKYGSFGISGGTPALTVDNAGRVGIGTASPTLDGSLAGLSVNASGTVLHIDDGDGATLKLTDPATGANRGFGISLQGTEAVISNCESGSLRFGTGNTERFRITSAGDIGIGRTDPQNIVGNHGGGLVVRSAAGRAATTTLFAVQSSNSYSMIEHLHNGQLKLRNDSNTQTLIVDNAGNLTATGNVTAYSDERLKSDITTIDDALDKVTAMRGVTFTKDGEVGSGVIAQELEKIAPELVMQGEEYKSVAYGNLVGYLIEAVKELSAKVEKLENGSSK